MGGSEWVKRFFSFGLEGRKKRHIESIDVEHTKEWRELEGGKSASGCTHCCNERGGGGERTELVRLQVL